MLDSVSEFRIGLSRDELNILEAEAMARIDGRYKNNRLKAKFCGMELRTVLEEKARDEGRILEFEVWRDRELEKYGSKK